MQGMLLELCWNERCHKLSDGFVYGANGDWIDSAT
jgi:hypothetical protein